MNGYLERDLFAKRKRLETAKYHLEAAILCGSTGFSLDEHRKEVSRRERAVKKAEKALLSN